MLLERVARATFVPAREHGNMHEVQPLGTKLTVVYLQIAKPYGVNTVGGKRSNPEKEIPRKDSEIRNPKQGVNDKESIPNNETKTKS